jgi:FKBP-type peptidyl-prolyl cis-trans isomerase FklB
MITSSVLILGVALPGAILFAQEAAALETDKQKISYSFGVTSARAVRGQFPGADLDLLIQGFRDGFSGTTLLTDGEVDNAIAELRTQLNVQDAGLPAFYAAVHGITDALSNNTITGKEAAAALDALEKRLAEQTQARGGTADSASNSVLRDRKSKLSYAFGVIFAKTLHQSSPDIDLNLVLRGLQDVFSAKPLLLMPRQIHTAAMQLRKQEAAAAAEANRKQGEAFLAANRNREGVITLESGLQYRILKAGDGVKPTIDDSAVCHYRGTLLNGTEFDNSYARNQPAVFELQKAMAGLREALQLMPAGSKWQLFIPGRLAHWPGGARSGVGPNETLIFELELLSVVKST